MHEDCPPAHDKAPREFANIDVPLALPAESTSEPPVPTRVSEQTLPNIRRASSKKVDFPAAIPAGERAYKLTANGKKIMVPLASYERVPASEAIRRRRVGFYSSIGKGVAERVAEEDRRNAESEALHDQQRGERTNLVARGALARLRGATPRKTA